MSGGVFAHWPNRITALRFVGALLLFLLYALMGDRGPADTLALAGVELGMRTALQVAFWTFVLVAATDFLDGWLARRGGQVSAFGRIADPFVDKVLILGAMIFLVVLPWSREYFPAWVVVVILARELLVTGLRGFVESLGREFPADRFGKLKMVVQCCAVGGAMFAPGYAWSDGAREALGWLVHGLVWLTVIATVGSGVGYVRKTQRILAEEGV
ncbi:MAG: CDP-diacylglycerol--glycerol-3-phosphate 3-phosphatidyltransferase [Planctomycetes bacterium]|nr:CDP-diacylglycerol--glycerol-3-phosphate 3-phosphatidyltransferase [Planctomycetota bacterium]